VAPDRLDVPPGFLRVIVDGESFCDGVGGCALILVDGVEVTNMLRHTHTELMFVVREPTDPSHTMNLVVAVAGQGSAGVSFRQPVPAFSAALQSRQWTGMSSLGSESF